MNDLGLPDAIEPWVAGYRPRRVGIGESGAHVFHLTREGGPALFLTCAAGDGSAELVAEAERLRWLTGRVPVPQVVAFAAGGEQTWLLLRALPGRNAAEIAPAQARAVVAGLATALRQLHAQPIATCPFDQRLAIQIERARERTRAGLLDEADFDRERRGRRTAELLLQLERERPQEEDPVLTHGDACLPNAIFDGDRFSGFVDWGMADRYQDLALAARSITSNLAAEWIPLFFRTYGLPDPDSSKLAYYRLPDEFF